MRKTSWQTLLMDAVTDPKELLELLELDPSLLAAAQKAAELFPLKVTRSFIARMQKRNLQDPLLRQIMPLGDELIETQDYKADPLEELKANPIPGLLHKYKDRVLITLTGICGINCRFCFRRSFPYKENIPGSQGLDKILEYLQQDQSLSEVILSGGDPLIATDLALKSFTDKLNQLPHIKRLRIHSRIPIVLPERITDEFIDWIKNLKQQLVLVVHCNHAQEIDASVESSLRRLKKTNAVLLNQSVLLKGVNDDAETLKKLSERLFESGIQPYYLHVLDKVQGVAHFDITLARAKEIYSELNSQISGYLVPKMVCEQPGFPAKMPIIPGDFYTD